MADIPVVITFIFSKDRAMQLDATLRSFFLHCKDSERASLNVLYQSSTPTMERQYQCLKMEYPQVNFIKESNFRENIDQIILQLYDHDYQSTLYRFLSKLNRTQLAENPMVQKIARKLSRHGIPVGKVPAPAPTGEKYVFFLVDDNLFVRPFNIETVTRALHSTSESVGFSLRLGKNTNFTYMLNRYQDLPEFEERGGGVLAYEWPCAQYDFNYPLEVSSSIFRAAQILPLLASISFSNPNTLESAMAERSRWFTRKFPKLLCFETSVTFCNPVNKVQTVEVGNRAGLAHSYTVEDLALYFDKGERIDVKTYSGFCPNACHQEIEIRFFSIL